MQDTITYDVVILGTGLAGGHTRRTQKGLCFAFG
jgi:hypothetical protein